MDHCLAKYSKVLHKKSVRVKLNLDIFYEACMLKNLSYTPSHDKWVTNAPNNLIKIAVEFVDDRQ